MKKKYKAIFWVIAILIVMSVPCDYVYTRAIRNHNIGEIHLYINDEVYTVDESIGVIQNYFTAEEYKIYNNCFKVHEGKYGENYYKFKLSPEFCINNISLELKDGLTVDFGFINTNNWHQNKYNIRIDISVDSIEVFEYIIKQSIKSEDRVSTKVSEGYFKLLDDTYQKNELSVIEKTLK